MKQGVALDRSAFLLVSFAVLLSFTAVAQQGQRYWIVLKDRGGHTELSNVNAQDLEISEHALWRRAKVLPADKLIDDLDLPVNQSYIDQLKSAGIVIRATSRWFNAISAELTPAQQSLVSSLSCVTAVEPVLSFVRHEPAAASPNKAISFPKNLSTLDLSYGPSATQLTNIKVVDVHALGINGTGIIVGMLDDGFNNHTTHPALKNIKVVAEYDFVQKDSNTSVAPGEDAGQGGHGQETLSAIGGFDSGKLIGVAYGASFILAKTEIDSVEIKLEEDLWVQGLEWEERLGADVVSSSLGYNDWYQYSDLNGTTATTTKAARIATRKGVLIVNAMGNEGNYQAGTNNTGTMIAPADADSVISVGAVGSDGTIASFSSTGPTIDGRMKPEVVAQGVSVYVASGTGGYQYSNGTSFSTPLTAGVATLVLSAHPTWTPMQVRNALMQTAKPLFNTPAGMITHPNTFFGWGLVDALKAVQSTSSIGGNGSIPTQFILHNNYPNPFNGSTAIVVDAPSAREMELSIYNILGQKVRTLFKGTSTPGVSTYFWHDGMDDANRHVATGVYICRLNAAGTVLSQKIVYLK
jgi:serine protease AprX